MTKEKSINLTPEEIHWTKVFCQNSMVLEPSIANLAKSILKKLSGKESETIQILIEEKPKTKKLGRPKKELKTAKTIKVLSTPEPQTSKPTAEFITSIEELKTAKPVIKKRGRPRKTNPIEVAKEILTITEPELENIEIAQETTILIEEQVVETNIKEETGTHLEESNTEKVIEIITVPESEQIETPSATFAAVAGQEVEPQPIVTSVNSEPEIKESDQPTSTEQNNPRINLFQKILKKLRPKGHS
jgi:hypothetical protein